MHKSAIKCIIAKKLQENEKCMKICQKTGISMLKNTIIVHYEAYSMLYTSMLLCHFNYIFLERNFVSLVLSKKCQNLNLL